MPYKEINLWEEYKKWLLHRVGFAYKGYSKLLDALHNTEFLVILDEDNNRLGDGNYQRYYFFESIRCRSGDFTMPCSILEMLIALAIRADDEYIGDPEDPKPFDFLWEMMENLGLNKLDNAHFSDDMFDDIMSKWMYREFDYDGNGSIFPLKHPKKDQRECEIWSQMQEYIDENY